MLPWPLLPIPKFFSVRSPRIGFSQDPKWNKIFQQRKKTNITLPWWIRYHCSTSNFLLSSPTPIFVLNKLLIEEQTQKRDRERRRKDRFSKVVIFSSDDQIYKTQFAERKGRNSVCHLTVKKALKFLPIISEFQTFVFSFFPKHFWGIFVASVKEILVGRKSFFIKNKFKSTESTHLPSSGSKTLP